jgi:DNA-directed RNA polymerase specialized sigma24 family protein
VATRKRSNQKSTEAPLGNTKQLEKLTRLLALLVVKGESQAEKIKLLAGAGFANTEIAELLGLTANAVNVALHRIRTKN